MRRRVPRYSSLQLSLLKKQKGLQKILVINSKTCQCQTNSFKERIAKSYMYDPVSVSRLESDCSKFRLDKDLYKKFVDYVTRITNNQNALQKRIDVTIDSICGQVMEQQKNELNFSSKNNNQRQFYLKLHQESLIKQMIQGTQVSSTQQLNLDFYNNLKKKELIIQRSLIRNKKKNRRISQNIEIQQSIQLKYERGRTIKEKDIKCNKINKPIKKVLNKIYLQDRVSKTVQNFLKDSLKNLREDQLCDKCIKEIFKIFRYSNKDFEEQVQEFKLSIQNFFFSNPSFYLHFETLLYELLNNSLILMSKYIDDNQKSLIYFTLIVVVLQIICKSDLYIFTYNMCKSIDVIIQKMSQVVKNTKIHDKLMLSYHYYKGFCQTNFDENHKFYDYIICKKYFKDLVYKKYPNIDLQEVPNFPNQTTFSLDNIKQAQNIIASKKNEKKKFRRIQGKSKKSKNSSQIQEVEQAFFENFFLCYIFFRQEICKFDDKSKYDLLEETLRIFKMNSKFDLGIQQINRCFPFQNKDALNKKCLKTIRYIMQRENFIKQVDIEKYTIYEKFISLNEEQREQISVIKPSKKQGLIKYLSLLADIHIYNKKPIHFLNLWRCISILDNKEIIKYMLYLEQLKWYSQDQFEDRYYEKIKMELESKLISFTDDQKQFWSLTYQNMKQNFAKNQLTHQQINAQKELPILSIRKIMNNILIEIQQHFTNQQDKFTLLFNFPYQKFKVKMQEDVQRQQQQSHKTLRRIQYTNSLKFNQKKVFIKVFNLQSSKENQNIEFNLTIYQFVQEIATGIYLREKQQQKDLPFQKNIGYHTFNRYIYHFVQDSKIFLILENYEILPKQVLNENHFRKTYFVQEEENSVSRTKSSSISSTKSYNIQDQDQVIQRRNTVDTQISNNSQQNNINERQRNISISSQNSQSSNTFIQPSMLSSISSQGQPQFNQKGQNQQSQQGQQQTSLQQKQRLIIFSKKDLFICMLRLEQAFDLLKENNMIHKDIKLDNLTMRETDEPILIDFGIIELYLVFSYYMSDAGTARYKSYQQHKGQPINENTDLTSLIITIYELTRGQSINLENQSTYFNKAQYISKHAHEELNDIFSNDFINLIEMVVDCQLDTIKSRAKYFMWQKFEIFMNLLFDCCDKNNLTYQKFYKAVKKAIIKSAVKKQKCELKVKFNIEELKSLNKDNTFLMLVSLQAHDILKMYESIISIVLNNQKMEEYKLLKNNFRSRHSSVSSQFSDANRPASSSIDSIMGKNYSKQSQYCPKNPKTAKVIEDVYNKCLINTNSIILQTFSEDVIKIFNSDFILQNLFDKKYEFDSEQLKKEYQELDLLKMSNQDQALVNKLYLKFIKSSLNQDVINQLTLHMEETQKGIFLFQQLTNQKIQEAYRETDSIKELMELVIEKNQPLHKLVNTHSQQKLYQNFDRYLVQLQNQKRPQNQAQEQVDPSSQQLEQINDLSIIQQREDTQSSGTATNYSRIFSIIGRDENTNNREGVNTQNRNYINNQIVDTDESTFGIGSFTSQQSRSNTQSLSQQYASRNQSTSHDFTLPSITGSSLHTTSRQSTQNNQNRRVFDLLTSIHYQDNPLINNNFDQEIILNYNEQKIPGEQTNREATYKSQKTKRKLQNNNQQMMHSQYEEDIK